jgi:hypothetical protein
MDSYRVQRETLGITGPGPWVSQQKVDEARLIARRLTATGKPVSRRALPSGGVVGSNEALNALVRKLKAELESTVAPLPRVDEATVRAGALCPMGETEHMRVLSDPTLGLVIEAAAARFTSSELKTLMMQADVYQYGKKEGNRQEILRSRLLGARGYAEEYGDTDARLALLTFIRMLVERTVGDPENAWPWFGPLYEALLADGYELTWERREPDRWDDAKASNFQILPTDAGPVPLATEISALEQELSSCGYDVALNHYRQAVVNFELHEEAANSQLRTALEELVMRLAEDHTNYVRPARAGDGRNAINSLTGTLQLAGDDGGDMLKGLWAMTHTRGSHPGRSNADETRFRLHVITATARLLLHRFPPRP